MNKQNLTDYLCGLLTANNPDCLNSFVHVGADEIPDAYLVAINDDLTNDGESEVWTEHSEVDLNNSSNRANEPEDFDEDNSYGDDGVGENDINVIRPAMDVILQERQAVILGNPGSGKTTLLQYVLHSMARCCMDNGMRTDVPVYIPLKELSPSVSLENWLESFISRSDFGDAFSRGAVFLFLDGLNEVLPSVYDSTIRTISQFMKVYPDCGVVITSRLYGYSGQLDIPSFLLQGLTDDNICSYIQKRIGDSGLFQYIKGHKKLHEQSRNPLLLNMFVSLWLSCGYLPKARLHLYDEFISYQLQKGGVVSNDDRQIVVDSLSRLAYSMRSYGYLSDSITGLDSIVSDWMDPDRVGEVTRMLMDSGLLSVTSKGIDFWCISFIHETFQEYFSTLYIYRDYVATGHLCVDFSLPEWGESLKMLTESLSLRADTDKLSGFLGIVCSQFEMGSKTDCFNDRLDRLLSTLSECFPHSPSLSALMEQYLFLNMKNFLKLPSYYRTVARFDQICSSLAVLGSSKLTGILFRSYKWLQYWLYDVDSLEYLGAKCLIPPTKVILQYLDAFPNKMEIYMYMQDIRTQYGCFESINLRLKYLMVYLANHMNREECREMYLAIGDMDALLRTSDMDFVERETEGKANILFPHLSSSLKVISPEAVIRFYQMMFGRMCRENQMCLLDSEVLADFILRCPGLDEVLLRESQFQKYQDQILAACFMVPCQYLSDYYFKLLPVLRDSIQLRSIHSVTSIIWYKAADGLFYLQLDIPNLSDGTDNEFQQLKKQYPDVRLRKIQLNYFAIDAELTEGTPQGVIKIEPNYTVDHEIIPIKRENRIIILCAQKTSYKPKNKYSVCMDGTTYLLKCCQKISVRMVNSYQMNNQVVEYSIKKGFNKELFRDYYYYFRADEVEPWQLDCSANLSYRLKAKLGLLGRLLDTVPAIDKLAVVLEVVDTRVIVQFRNKATLSRFPQRYTVLKPGDIVFKYESKLYKIENQMLLDNVAMVHGEVVSKNGDNLFIAFPDNEYNKDYYYFDVNQEFKIGDKVRFFPVLNRANRFYGSPLACLVRKDEA
ncbi:NACHT domain-containing protein [Parabacteroides merdae]|jgi:hypothetical protein|uniref:NACHT domain-containing protein n=1 Tax=Parabacteroides merdae TaxID=46503 RepID=UPI0022E6383D|nr:hypothetical protein [Parabacteroides merdae]MBS4867495.1 hypothetical protein [Parabacteroides merdae]